MGCPALTIYDYFRVEYPEYDPAGQLASAKKFFSDNTQDFSYNYSFNYDPAGNSLKRISQGQERNYTFNNLNQFTSATSPDKMDITGSVSPTIVNPSITVNGEPGTVNENGSWVKEAVPLTQGENDIVVEAKDMFDREKTETRKVTLLPPPVFTYDANGNMTSDGLWAYTWNDENRMISASSVSSLLKIENVYDGLGRRRIKKVYENEVLKSEIHFVYDGLYIMAEADASGNLLRRYVRNGDQLLAVEDIALGKTFYYCTDGNKNVTDLVDTASGEIVAHYEYSPFGKIVSQSGNYADTNPFRFSSEYFDKETGLIAFLYRDYSPEYARWMSRDPIEEAGGINLYHYVSNDPVNYWDWLGLQSPYGESIESMFNRFVERCDKKYRYPECEKQRRECYQSALNWLSGVLDSGGDYYHKSWLGKQIDRASGGISEYWDSQTTGNVLGDAYAEWLKGGAMHVTDLGRFGESFGEAAYFTEGDWLDKLSAGSKDFVRVSEILAIAAGAMKSGKNVMEYKRASDIRKAEQHLKNLKALDDPANQEMLQRLKSGKIGAAEKTFLEHEIKESKIIKNYDSYEEARRAHLETLRKQRIEYKKGYERELYGDELYDKYIR